MNVHTKLGMLEDVMTLNGSSQSLETMAFLVASDVPDPVIPVPLPGTLALFATGLAGLIFMRRRRAA